MNAMPLDTIIIANVTMNGGIMNFVTMTPEKMPESAQTAIAKIAQRIMPNAEAFSAPA